MAYMWSEQIDAVLAAGGSLEQEGIRNFALEKSAALLALDQFFELQVAVLGGDVYAFENDRWQSNYDNWFCDRLAGETFAEFVHRSINKAREYILAYQTPNVRFALVPQATP
jgi:hypothetical protein